MVLQLDYCSSSANQHELSTEEQGYMGEYPRLYTLSRNILERARIDYFFLPRNYHVKFKLLTTKSTYLSGAGVAHQYTPNEKTCHVTSDMIAFLAGSTI